VPEENLDALLAEPLLKDYSPDPNPLMRGSIACTGTEFCSLSIVETKNRQVRYARWLTENVNLPENVDDFHIHLSGCTASCAQPQIADISLRGMKTRKDGEPVEALDIGLGGGLGEHPRFADWVEMRVPADEVPGRPSQSWSNPRKPTTRTPTCTTRRRPGTPTPRTTR